MKICKTIDHFFINLIPFFVKFPHDIDEIPITPQIT